MNEGTARALGVLESATVTLSTDSGSVTLPLRIADVADSTVWAPLDSEGSAILPALGAGHGAIVRVTGDGA